MSMERNEPTMSAPAEPGWHFAKWEHGDDWECVWVNDLGAVFRSGDGNHSVKRGNFVEWGDPVPMPPEPPTIEQAFESLHDRYNKPTNSDWDALHQAIKRGVVR